MSFTAPVWLAVAGLVAAGVVIAHLITITAPRREILPTVRFIPQIAPLTVTRTRRPTDLVLLLLRLTAVAQFGLALAGAHVARSAPGRVVLVDYSTAGSDGGQQLRTATADSVVIVFGDSVGPGTLSGALVAAHRAVAGRDGRERAELVIVSPLARFQIDSATAPLLALWPGPIHVIRTPAVTSPSAGELQVRATGDDPVAAAAQGATGRVRLFRAALPGRADSVWARDSGGVLVVWPADLSTARLTRREQADTQQGIAARADVVIGTFHRTHAPRNGRAIVRWLDGLPAASQVALGAGCIREVAIPVDVAGDMALRESFRGVLATLTSPCDGPRDLAPADLASLLPADTRPRIAGVVAPEAGNLAIWLAFGALVVLAVEQLLRRKQA
jgi:hypothetical protein